MSSRTNIRLSVLIVMILIAAFSRMIPHMLNFSPLGAISLFGAAYFTRKWQAFVLPILATWVSDLFINNVVYASHFKNFIWFYEGFYWPYASYLLIAGLGLLLYKNVSAGKVAIGALGSSLIFFLVTNFAIWPGNPFYTAPVHPWPGSPTYSKDLQGLLDCYIAALPFVKGTIAGDLFYSAALFGSFSLLQSKFPKLFYQREPGRQLAV